jgi:cellulose synthase/poly-beta-1,6-N-acetylglucosamine synthase-like glycosyltransferase
MGGRSFAHLPDEFEELLSSMTVIIQAYNEEETIVDTVQSVLKETYPGLQIVVVNDGSEDATLQRLDEAYDLTPSTDVVRIAVPCSNLLEVYQSDQNEAVHVIDKEKNSEVLKGDALNAGLNLAETPLICCIDADSVLEDGCLKTLARPFLRNPETVAAGGTIRVANGSTINNSTLQKVSLSWNPLELFQVVEYLRAFLFGRMGWVPFNALPVISGALGLFDRQTLIDVGGFKNDSVSEDMEIILRMHRKLSAKNESYKIDYVPDPICWTQVPSDVNSLRTQRISWQQGLSESIFSNLGLFGESRTPGASLMSFPYLIVVEWFGALVEVSGYTFMAVGILTGYLSPFTTIAFFLVAIGLGIFHSVFTLLLEVISFRVYSDISHLIKLFGAAVLENFGYRQVNSLWRTYGVIRYLIGKRGYPGEKKRRTFNPED